MRMTKAQKKLQRQKQKVNGAPAPVEKKTVERRYGSFSKLVRLYPHHIRDAKRNDLQGGPLYKALAEEITNFTRFYVTHDVVIGYQEKKKYTKRWVASVPRAFREYLKRWDNEEEEGTEEVEGVFFFREYPW